MTRGEICERSVTTALKRDLDQTHRAGTWSGLVDLSLVPQARVRGEGRDWKEERW